MRLTMFYKNIILYGCVCMLLIVLTIGSHIINNQNIQENTVDKHTSVTATSYNHVRIKRNFFNSQTYPSVRKPLNIKYSKTTLKSTTSIPPIQTKKSNNCNTIQKTPSIFGFAETKPVKVICNNN